MQHQMVEPQGFRGGRLGWQDAVQKSRQRELQPQVREVILGSVQDTLEVKGGGGQ